MNYCSINYYIKTAGTGFIFRKLKNQKEFDDYSRIKMENLDSKILVGPLDRSLGRGLHNLGNSCYMNSVLQCLFHLPCLSNILFELRNTHIDDCKLEKCILCAFVKTFNDCLVKVGAPWRIRNVLKDICKTMEINVQEDGHEFLRCLTGSLNDDIMKKIFGFNLINETFCDSCPDMSMIGLEYFMDISVELQNRPSLEWALSDFFSQKTIEDRVCDGCNKSGKGKTQYYFEKPPYVLVIHLKRFFMDSYGRRKKIADWIPFNLKLDLSPFVKNGNSKVFTYSLRSTINHIGDGALNGHYTASIQGANLSFFHFNDSSVSPIGNDELLQSKAPYVLFYGMENSSMAALNKQGT